MNLNTDRTKLARRARHRTPPVERVDTIATDAPRSQAGAFEERGVEVECA